MSKKSKKKSPVIIPKEALAYLKNKFLKPAFSYKDVWQSEHNKAFTIAKMMNIDLLKDMQDSLTKTMKSGETYKTWAKDVTKHLQDKGWWGKAKVLDPETGKEVESQLGNARRLQIIFDVNMRQAHQKGVWERGYQSETHPYLMYRIGVAEKHRPEHLAWDGLVLPKDDPFWITHNPTNGYGCHCESRFVSNAKKKLLEKSGVPDMDSIDKEGRPTKTKVIKTTSPQLNKTTYINKRTGKTHEGYEGIDPGFEHNPGTTEGLEFSK